MENNAIEKLMQLKELYEKGIITKDELDSQKNILLEQSKANEFGTARTGGKRKLNIKTALIISLIAVIVLVVILCIVFIPKRTSAVVDLGLSVKWATCNLNASGPEETGGYFSWSDFGADAELPEIPDDAPRGMFETLLVDIPATLPIENDVANRALGGKWRMPTEEEFKELIDNCTSKWTMVNNVWGREFTSKKNGESIFLPALTDKDGYCGQNMGCYLSSSLHPNDWDYAMQLQFDASEVCTRGEFWDWWCQIRPVCEK